MKLYAIFRRNAWGSMQELAQADARSRAAREGRSDLRHVRSYVLAEPGQRVGTICLYEADSPQGILDHARSAQLPADEVIEVSQTVVAEPEPVAHA